MLEGLYSAAAGMSAQQQQLDAVSNDLANVSTTGYKSERVGFQDLLYNQVNQAGTTSSTGAGASAHVIGHDQSQGSIQDSGNPFDLAIQGDGFFQVKRADGSIALTRNGAFGVDARGRLTTNSGHLLDPPITVPAGVAPSSVQISADGSVHAGSRTLGQIKLVNVTAPDRLLANGDGEFTTSAASGTPHAASDATIRQGALEGSNVDIATAMATMMTTQRSYQLASNAIHTQDQMMSIANQLRG
ncbi:MAG TPA: flagellar hook-basal body protein [Solirubrobacteraceae bacterium]|nr:flagellar hook-basal body protein [Solirubrobacteraceae bacterium]